jgi:nucleoside-diphosphate-sugar epimerase
MEQTAGKNMKILVIGGTGFISSSMTRKLLERGHTVTLFNRGKSKKTLDHPALNYFSGNRDNIKDLRSAAGSDNFDVVYDMVAYTPDQSKQAAEVFKDNTSRFIHCSTISVYMISNEVTIPITEDQDRAPIMEYNKRNPFGMDYGINKRKCEEVLWNYHDKNSFPVTAVRPTFVCGPGDPAHRDYFWIERILDGKPLLVPGTGEYKFQHIFVEDCAEIFCNIIESDRSIGESYNAASEEVFTLNSYLHSLAGLLNKNIDVVHMEQKEFDELKISSSLKGDVFPFNPRRDTVFSLDKVKEHLNYTSTPFNQWMPGTIDWYKMNYKKHSAGYEYRDKEIKVIEKLKQKI